MKTNFILLGGAAALALLGVQGMTPVHAQYAGNPPQYSTPAEKAQTRQLNDQAINGTDQSPAELNGETNPPYNPRNYPSTNSPTYGTYGGYGSNPAPQSVNPDDAASPYYGTPTNNSGPPNYSGYPTGSGYPGYGNPNYTGYPSTPQRGQYGGYSYQSPQDEEQQQTAPPGYQQQQYDQEMQQYQNQQQEYQDQRSQYEGQRDRYERNIRWFDQARWAYVFPDAVVYSFDAPRMMRVDMISEPSQLVNVPIEGPSGRWVGRVRYVQTTPDGRAARIKVALNRRISVWVDPRNIRFDPRDRVAFTNLTREDLWNSPGAIIESYPM